MVVIIQLQGEPMGIESTDFCIFSVLVHCDGGTEQAREAADYSARRRSLGGSSPEEENTTMPLCMHQQACSCTHACPRVSGGFL